MSLIRKNALHHYYTYSIIYIAVYLLSQLKKRISGRPIELILLIIS